MKSNTPRGGHQGGRKEAGLSLSPESFIPPFFAQLVNHVEGKVGIDRMLVHRTTRPITTFDPDPQSRHATTVADRLILFVITDQEDTSTPSSRTAQEALALVERIDKERAELVDGFSPKKVKMANFASETVITDEYNGIIPGQTVFNQIIFNDRMYQERQGAPRVGYASNEAATLYKIPVRRSRQLEFEKTNIAEATVFYFPNREAALAEMEKMKTRYPQPDPHF